jgi:hypothetical protein
MKANPTRPLLIVLILTGIIPFLFTLAQAESDRMILEDFSRFPEQWESRSGLSKINEVYQVITHERKVFLRARTGSESVRIFKKIAWDSEAFPIVEWRWKINQWPKDQASNVYFYISLDRDVFGIPTLIKYIWSGHDAVGTIKDGGFFRPMEVVVRSGSNESGDWAIQRVNARADFRQFIGRIPKGRAYGIGILVDPGMDVEFGEIVAIKN